LRAVLAQRLVDRARALRRMDPLPDRLEALPRSSAQAHDPDRARFQPIVERAVADAIANLEPRDRLRLSCYYAQGMKLAALGRMLREHEATVSRHLTRTRATIRAAVDARLRADHGLDDRAVAECFRAVADDPGAMDLGTLLGSTVARKIAPVARSEK
jgi:DNA-directed RNA polymerase specialized sigma24 family protein